MPLSQVVKVVDRVLGALSGIHAAGQAHGAIGPEAVLFRQKGDALTVVLWSPDEPPEPAYSPPERVTSAAGDAFSVGVLMHHMITGRAPPSGTALISLEGHTLQDVPEALDDLILRLAHPDPDGRPRSIPEVQSTLQNLELDSTLSGARLQAARAAVTDTPARQVMLSAPYDDEVDPHEDTYVRGTPGLEAAVRQVASEQAGDPFADTVIGRREDIEATADAGMQDTLLGVDPSPYAPALAALDARTEMLPDSAVAKEAPARWILVGVLAGLALGGVVAAVLLL